MEVKPGDSNDAGWDIEQECWLMLDIYIRSAASGDDGQHYWTALQATECSDHL